MVDIYAKFVPAGSAKLNTLVDTDNWVNRYQHADYERVAEAVPNVPINYVPTVVGQVAGTGAAYSVYVATYYVNGPYVEIRFDIKVDAAGTASSNLLVTVPTGLPQYPDGYAGNGYGTEEALTGQTIAARTYSTSTTQFIIHLYNGNSPIVTGYRLVGFYKYVPA